MIGDPAEALQGGVGLATQPQLLHLTNARTGTLNAAKDLFGAGSAQYNAVGAAWSAVNVK